MELEENKGLAPEEKEEPADPNELEEELEEAELEETSTTGGELRSMTFLLFLRSFSARLRLLLVLLPRTPFGRRRLLEEATSRPSR